MSQEVIVANETSIAYMKAELDTAIMTAQLIKRNIDTFMEEATKIITTYDGIAESCIFSLPRKKKNEKTGQYEQTYLKGKSVRLSEIILSNYENITVGSRIIHVGAESVTVEGCAWDLQKRAKFTAEITENVNGKHTDAVKLAIGSATSKATRNAIFKVVGPLADVLYKRAVEHLVGDQKTFPVKRAKVFERMKIQGVEPEKIFAYYDKTGIEDFTPDLIEEIIGIGTAIKEGELKIDKAFVKTETANDAKERLENITNKSNAAAFMKEGKITSINISNINNEQSTKPEIIVSGDIFENIKKQLHNAKSEDSLHVVADMIREVKDPILHDELQGIYKARLSGFNKDK